MSNIAEAMFNKLGVSSKSALEGTILSFTAKVKPQARKNSISWREGEFHIQINVPAIDGKANSALCEYLADVFELSRSSIEIAKGEKGRKKTFLLLIRDDKLEKTIKILEQFYEP